MSASIISKRSSRLEATISDNALLQPGPIAIRLAADILLGDPPVPHRGVSSNLSAFVLIPHVTAMAVVPPGVPGDPPALDIQGTRLFQQNKESVTLIGDRVVSSSAYTTKLTNHIVLEAPEGLAAGTYAVRVRVNGAESIDTQNLVI
jgi:hypothetical protein